MNKLMTVNTLGPHLIALLGLPPHVKWLELRCAVGELVTVKCEYYPEIGASFDTAITEYEVVPRTSDSAPAHDSITGGRHFDAWMRERTEAAHAEFMARTMAKPRYAVKIDDRGYVAGFGLMTVGPC